MRNRYDTVLLLIVETSANRHNISHLVDVIDVIVVERIKMRLRQHEYLYADADYTGVPILKVVDEDG